MTRHRLYIYFFLSERMGGIKADFVVLYLSACHINISVTTDRIIIKLPFILLDMSPSPAAQKVNHTQDATTFHVFLSRGLEWARSEMRPIADQTPYKAMQHPRSFVPTPKGTFAVRTQPSPLECWMPSERSSGKQPARHNPGPS